MPVDEYFWWAEIYALESDAAKRAHAKAKAGRGKGKRRGRLGTEG
jgi:hypothetical protein